MTQYDETVVSSLIQATRDGEADAASVLPTNWPTLTEAEKACGALRAVSRLAAGGHIVPEDIPVIEAVILLTATDRNYHPAHGAALEWRDVFLMYWACEDCEPDDGQPIGYDYVAATTVNGEAIRYGWLTELAIGARELDPPTVANILAYILRRTA